MKVYKTKNLKWSKSHCCLKKVLYSPRSSTSSPGPPKWKVDLIELLGQSECLHLGKESYAKSWFRVYKVCIIGRAKRSQQHPVFQGGQPAKYLMTGLNIVYLQWSDENWCQCDMAVASETLNFRKKTFVTWILKVNHWQATTESSKNFVQPALYVSWHEYSMYQAYPKICQI